MILDLRGYKSFPVKARLSADHADNKTFSTDQTQVESLTLELDVHESAGQFYCHGTVLAAAKMECARCLVLFPCELEYETSFTVRAQDYEESDDSKGIIDDEIYLSFQGGDLTVDVTEQVHQAVLLAEPMHPLCAENCKGICSSCGGNLNVKDCGCRRDHIDSRWDGLKELKDLR